MAFLKPKNTKTSLYKLSKDHWVIAFSKNSQSVRKKLQSTVSLDHPVSTKREEKPIYFHYLVEHDKDKNIQALKLFHCPLLSVK